MGSRRAHFIPLSASCCVTSMQIRRNFFRTAQRQKWQEGVYHNPYFDGGKRPWKRRLVILSLITGAGALIGFFLFTPLLRLKTYRIDGAEFIGADVIERAARASLAGRKMLVIPKDHLFFFSEEQLSQTLFDQFRLDRLDVERQGRELHLRVAEKISRVVWQAGEHLYVVDEYGIVLNELDTLAEDHAVTMIRSLREETPAPGERVLDAKTMSYLLDLLLLLREGPLNPVSLEVDSTETHFLRVNMEDGYAVFFDPTVPMNEQLDRLGGMLKSESANPSSYEYIDVRFGERVYIKNR